MDRRCIALALFASLLLIAAPARAGTPDAAVSARQDAGRSGFLGGASLGRPPLSQRWSIPVGYSATTPLVVGNRVFVASRPRNASGSTVAALDVATGTEVWSRTVPGTVTLAYGDGRLAAMSTDAVVGLDAASGARLWAASQGGTAGVVDGGLLFLTGNDLSALRMSDGQRMWHAYAGYGANGPVAGGGLVAVSPGCASAYEAATGALAWTGGPCSSSDVATDGGVVVRSSGSLLDLASGAVRDTAAISFAPALAGDTLVHYDGYDLTARSLASGVTLWRSPSTWTNGLDADPIVVDGVVYAVRNGRLDALDLQTGAVLWTGTPPVDPDSYENGRLTLAAGGGLLLVAGRERLTAYGSAATSPGAGLAVTSGPSGPVRESAAGFAFTAPAGVTTDCRIDDRAWAPCAGAADYAGLAEGPHAFSVRAVAGGDVVGLAARGFSVDRTAPTTTIDGGPSGLTRDTYTYFSVSSSGGRTPECRLDAGDWAPCQNSYTVTDGDHVLRARSRDVAGNVEDPPAERRWTQDTIPPRIFIAGHPPQVTNQTSATVTFSVPDAARVRCRWDNGETQDCTSPAHRDDLADGSHFLVITAVDDAGNWNDQDLYWQVDTHAPASRITRAPDARSADRQPSVFFVADEDDARFQCRVDHDAFMDCWSPWIVPSQTAGDHVAEVRAYDAAGNVESTPSRAAFTVEGTDPAPAGSYATPAPYPYPTPTPVPVTTYPTYSPGTAATAAPAAGTGLISPPAGYVVLAIEDTHVVTSPAALGRALRAYLKGRRVSRSLKLTVPFVGVHSGALSVRLVAGRRTLTRSSVPVTAGALAWPRLEVGRPAHSRTATLVIRLAGQVVRTRVRLAR